MCGVRPLTFRLSLVHISLVQHTQRKTLEQFMSSVIYKTPCVTVLVSLLLLICNGLIACPHFFALPTCQQTFGLKRT